MKKFGTPKLRCRAIVANFEARRERKSGGNSAVESGRVVANIKCGFDVTLAGFGTLLEDSFLLAHKVRFRRSLWSPLSFISFVFPTAKRRQLRYQINGIETKSLATGLENGKNRTEMSSSFWVRVRSRTNLFLVLLSGVSSERGKQASLAGLNFGVQPFSHFALAIFLPREIAVLFLFLRRRLSGTGAILVVSYTENANKKTWNKWRLVESKPGNETWSEIRIGWAGRRRESR